MAKLKSHAARERLSRAVAATHLAPIVRDPEILLGERRRPLGWKSMSNPQKLDYIAGRMIAEDRAHITNHRELKATGILSPQQMQRRQEHEVYDHPALHGGEEPDGIFSRAYVPPRDQVKKIAKLSRAGSPTPALMYLLRPEATG